MTPSRKRRRLSNENEQDAVQKHAEEGPDAKKQQQRRSLFVRSLPATTTTDALITHFSQSFPIKHATAVIDPSTQQCRGYGFITFADAEDAQRALEEFDNSEIQGRKIRLEVAERRHREIDDIVPGEAEAGSSSRPRSKNVLTGAAAEAKARRDAEKQQMLVPPPRLIVRNLPWSIKDPEQLSVLFRSYGKIKNVTLPSKKPGLMAGFGFVTLRGRKNAEKAIQGVNGKKIDGRTVAVDWAVDKDTWQAQQDEQPNDDKEAVVPETAGDGDSDDEVNGIAESDEDTDGVQDEDEDESDIDMEDDYGEDDEDLDDEEEQDSSERPAQDFSSTLFIRNLPFSSSDENLFEQFSQFGKLRYARIVMDHDTERPKGTGFVCFFNAEDARTCLREAPDMSSSTLNAKTATKPSAQSILQSELDDPSGRYTMDGRVLQISKAVDRSEAARLTEQGVSQRGEQQKDKRRLYLLSEGTISSKSPLYKQLSATEIGMREASAKQRKTLIQSNPSLHLSLTRLSVRNIPRSVTSKDLKALARQAVVGFAKDAKEGKRQRLSPEELERGGEEMALAEKLRKRRGVGVVKQAKVVFEDRDGSKVAERSGAGKSRGYGFIEYHTHRMALMGLRWLNGHAVEHTQNQSSSKPANREEQKERKKRLIVEFAIENAQVVKRRTEKEQRARGSSGPRQGHKKDDKDTAAGAQETGNGEAKEDKGKQAKRQRIINKKRAARRARRKGSKTA